MAAPDDAVEVPSLADLRERRSAKWTMHPEDVLPCSIAEMDYKPARPIRAALINAVELGDLGYPTPAGLGESFASFALDWFGWQVNPTWISLVPDVLVGIAETLRITTRPRSRVVINSPAYPPFIATLLEYGREVVDVPLVHDGRSWTFDFDSLDGAFRAGAEGFLLCNPHNPLGTVLSRPEVEEVARLACRYGVCVVSDEIHAPLTYPGSTHTPYTSLGDGLVSNAVTVTSASKAWNIAGLKCAVVVAGSEEMAERLRHMPSQVAGRASQLGVIASIAAFNEGRAWLRQAIAALDQNRRLLDVLLSEHLPGIRYEPPQAGYLAWLDCRELGLGADPAGVFLERGRVALRSGLEFGAKGSGFARFNFGTSTDLLVEAVARMRTAVRG